jgi:hypothetical protein
MSKRAYWIVRPEGATAPQDLYVNSTKRGAYELAAHLVAVGFCGVAYVERCYRQTVAVTRLT